MNLYFTQMDPPVAAHYRLLAARGWTLQHLPFRRPCFYEPPADLHPAHYDLIILSSKQAAKWLCRYFPPPLPPIAAVGRTTASLLNGYDLWFDDPPPAHGAELVDRLNAELPPGPRLLFLHGHQAKRVIPTGLAAFSPVAQTVYGTEKLLTTFAPLPQKAVVYFQAPSTVADYLEIYGVPPWRIAAIGPSTATALRGLGWEPDFCPSRPETACFIAELPTPTQFLTRASSERKQPPL